MLSYLIQDQPGEPPLKSRYRDPHVLKSYGYEALIIPHALKNLLSPWGESDLDLREKLLEAKKAGLQVFFLLEALALPKALIEDAAQEFVCQDGSGALCPALPGVWDLWEKQLDMLLSRWPQLSGLILQTPALPWHAGAGFVQGSLLETCCPRCRNLSSAQRLGELFRRMQHVTIERHQRLYIHRLYQRRKAGLPNLQDDATLLQEALAQVPPSDSLILSYRVNPPEIAGHSALPPALLNMPRKKWLEITCERECEGKGAFPNYFMPGLWKSLEPGISLALRSGAIAGFSAIVRGGSLGGPYLQREEWLDANVYALGALYRQTTAEGGEIAQQWARKTLALAGDSPAAEGIARILELSTPALHGLLYDPASHGLQLDLPWTRGDLLDVEAIWRSAGDAVRQGHVAELGARKTAALREIETMRGNFTELAGAIANKSLSRDLANTLTFYNSFAGAVVNLFLGLAHYQQWQRNPHPTAIPQAIEELEAAQAYWQHHTQRHALLPGVPSAFNENSFWERTNDALEDLRGAVSPPAAE